MQKKVSATCKTVLWSLLWENKSQEVFQEKITSWVDQLLEFPLSLEALSCWWWQFLSSRASVIFHSVSPAVLREFFSFAVSSTSWKREDDSLLGRNIFPSSIASLIDWKEFCKLKAWCQQACCRPSLQLHRALWGADILCHLHSECWPLPCCYSLPWNKWDRYP